MSSPLIPWIESLMAALIAVLAFLAGRWFARLPRPYWLMGYCLPLGCILLYCLALFEPRLGSVPPVSWMVLGRSRFISFNVIATLLLTVPLTRLRRKRNRVRANGSSSASA